MVMTGEARVGTQVLVEVDYKFEDGTKGGVGVWVWDLLEMGVGFVVGGAMVMEMTKGVCVEVE